MNEGPDEIARPLATEPEFLRPDWTERKLVRSEAGIRIKELNAYLDAHGLALSNMGGYDHQTIAGVISTSTHFLLRSYKEGGFLIDAPAQESGRLKVSP